MRPFLDTNILIYAASDDPRRTVARALLRQPFELSVQSLNEFANVSRRKLGQDWQAIEWGISIIVELSGAIHPLTLDVHIRGLALAERLKLQLYDATLVATALKAGCDTFFTEDMHDGLVVEERLTIRNPFAPS